MTPSDDTLRLTASYLAPHRDALLESWIAALGALSAGPYDEVRESCTRTVDALLDHAARGRVEEFLAAETEAAARQARAGRSFLPVALSIRVFDRACLPFLLGASKDKEELAQVLLALDELGDRRLELLLRAQEDENARRLVEAQEQAARADERSREVQRANDALRRARSQSQHRADQIALFNDGAWRRSSTPSACSRPRPRPCRRAWGTCTWPWWCSTTRACWSAAGPGVRASTDAARGVPRDSRAASSAGRCASARRRSWPT